MKNRICLLLLIFGLTITGCSRPAEDSIDEKGSSSIPIPNDYFILDSTPQFKSFSEVAYYSYLVEKGNEFNVLKPRQRIMDKTANEKDKTSDSSYVDEQGRTHYPIPIEKEYTFSNFLYFDFVSNNCEFLEDRIGNGNIKGLVVQTSIFGEEMLVLKNMDKYYSCLINGASAIRNGGEKPNKRFSAHKYIEEFDVVKDNNKQTITLTFDDEIYRPLTLSTIDFEGITFDVLPDSVFFDEQEVTCSVNELRKHFGLEPDPRFEEKEYVEGRQIFDVFEKVACPVSFEANGFPDDFFQYHDDGYYTFTNSFNLPAVNCSLYLADVNCDGNDEICYLNQKGSDVRYQTIIYDYKNGNVLANEEFEHWKGYTYFSLLDEKLILNYVNYDYAGTTIPRVGTRCREKIAKFVKNNDKKVIMDYELIPFRLLGFSFMMCQKVDDKYERYIEQENGAYLLNKNQEYYLSGSIYHDGSTTLNTEYLGDCFNFESNNLCSISFVELKTDDYQWFDFYYKLDFKGIGETSITVSLAEFETTVKIKIVE